MRIRRIEQKGEQKDEQKGEQKQSMSEPETLSDDEIYSANRTGSNNDKVKKFPALPFK